MNRFVFVAMITGVLAGFAVAQDAPKPEIVLKYTESQLNAALKQAAGIMAMYEESQAKLAKAVADLAAANAKIAELTKVQADAPRP